ncbi:TPA: ATP-dependent helicase [Methanosarcinaceae archaeon]|nr:ATP-dependent helicase [Methanosarcinaceae archaeon]
MSQENLTDEERKRQELLEKLYQKLGRDEYIEKLSLEQLEFIVNPITNSSFLNSCPGSGKTEVVGFKAAYEASSWESPYSGMAILSFTKNAASEIWKRANKYSTQKAVQFPHFVGTLDSWLHQYVFQPFCYSVMDYEGKDGDTSVNIIDSDSNSPFLENYKSVISYPPAYQEVKVNEYYIDSDDSIKFNRNRGSNLDSYQKAILFENKLKFARSGFATYQDAEYWSYKILNENEMILDLISKRFPYIIIDECQDLAPSRLDVIETLQDKGVVFHFVGDINQSIYDFIDVDPSQIQDFIINSGMREMKLTKNFRSNQEIANLCARLVGIQDSPEGRATTSNAVSCVLWECPSDQLHVLPSHFEWYLNSKNIECGNCSILVRGKSLLNKLKNTTPLKSISFDIAKAFFLWNSESRKTEYITDALELLGRSMCNLAYKGRGNPQNQHCPESFEHIDWRIFLSNILNSSKDLATFKNEDRPQTWSQWCGSLKIFLEAYFLNLPDTYVGWNEAKRKIKAPSRKANELVSNSLSSSTYSTNIRMTTIHDVKGETLDAVMLISNQDRRSRGGHFEDWVEDPTSEYARFAYVACSRPRDLLIVVAPTLSELQKTKLENIGLVSEELPGTLSQWF